MRLITKIVLIFLGLSFIVFIIGGVLTVQIISNEGEKGRTVVFTREIKFYRDNTSKEDSQQKILIRDKVINFTPNDSIEIDNIRLF